jgi:hypothetical protein
MFRLLRDPGESFVVKDFLFEDLPRRLRMIAPNAADVGGQDGGSVRQSLE